MSNVVVLGASTKPERYSNKAVRMLQANGHTVFAVSPSGEEIEGAAGYTAISEIMDEFDTVTVYVNPDRLAGMLDEVLAKHPRRIIFNPGTEAPELQQQAVSAGVHVVEACTLVLLTTGQFDDA